MDPQSESPADVPAVHGEPLLPDDVTSDQLAALRGMFGIPQPEVAPVLEGEDADRVVSDPHIAIIDDEPINIKVVQKYLKLAGYQRFCTTTDATQAMQLIRARRPDVVLLDIMMPHVSGLEILDQLRANAEFKDLPVIILTAACDRETKLDALRRGANEFLAKPIDAVELEARLRNILVLKAHQDRIKQHAGQLELEVARRSAELAMAHQQVLDCLARVGEYRDNETGQHVVRVGCYASIIAQRLGMDAEYCHRIRQAAALHDIGKVAVPDVILLKPGKLTDEEFRRMQEHCVAGRNICCGHAVDAEIDCRDPRLTRGMSPLLRMAAAIAYTHHERWDGTGYPRGLEAEAIPLEGRIAAVADVFDALTSQRPYKKAFPVEKALEIIRSERGSHFDPAVVDAFFESLDDILHIYRECADRPATPNGSSESAPAENAAQPSAAQPDSPPR